MVALLVVQSQNYQFVNKYTNNKFKRSLCRLHTQHHVHEAGNQLSEGLNSKAIAIAALGKKQWLLQVRVTVRKIKRVMVLAHSVLLRQGASVVRKEMTRGEHDQSFLRRYKIPSSSHHFHSSSSSQFISSFHLFIPQHLFHPYLQRHHNLFT